MTDHRWTHLSVLSLPSNIKYSTLLCSMIMGNQCVRRWKVTNTIFIPPSQHVLYKDKELYTPKFSFFLFNEVPQVLLIFPLQPPSILKQNWVLLDKCPCLLLWLQMPAENDHQAPCTVLRVLVIFPQGLFVTIQSLLSRPLGSSSTHSTQETTL